MDKQTKEIYLAGGCFWGTEHYFKQVEGVVETEVGYANGIIDNPTYEQVCTDTTQFAETVRVVYDPEKASLEFLLNLYFMAIDPVSHKDHIWDDVTRMRTLNSRQSQKNLRMHVCPLQLDIVERLITRYSNKGDVVFDPFGGIGTVPYCAVKLGRKGLSTELNFDYWRDGLAYLREAESEVTSPTLFDLMDVETKDAV